MDFDYGLFDPFRLGAEEYAEIEAMTEDELWEYLDELQAAADAGTRTQGE